MSKNIIKAIVLGVLIITCIVQTAILWLGGVSGHNFLGKESSVAVPLEPESIWINTVRFAYPINDRKREYNKLIVEISNLLALPKKEIKLQEVPGYGWKDILSEPGIIYEYSVPISLEEIAGTSVTSDLNINMKHLVLTVPIASTNKVVLYVVGDKDNKVYKVDLFGETDNLVKIQEAFTKEEIIQDRTSYQASVFTNENNYIKGNVFLSLNSKNNPLKYNRLRAYNPMEIDKTKKIEHLETYVNSLFANPLTKKIEEKENGTVTFTEYRKGIVTYRPTGVVEYVNFNQLPLSNVMTKLEGYKVAADFWENTDSIHKKIKSNLYMSDIVQNGEEYTYYFDMNYRGHKINLSEPLKKDLGVKAAVELTVKNYQITKGKWLVLELLPIYEGNRYCIESLEEGYIKPIERLIEAGVVSTAYNTTKLQDLECVYVLEGLKKDIHMRWAAMYNNKWDYP